MVKPFAFDGNAWREVSAIYSFHYAIGFVKLNSVRVHDGTNWLTVELPDGSMTLVQQAQELVDA